MKVLHTGDWHVGRTIRNQDRYEEHRAVLTEIRGIAEDERVDAVLIAGDLYHYKDPKPEARELLAEQLAKFSETGIEIVIIGGNHDAPAEIQAVKHLGEIGRNVHVVAKGAGTVPLPGGGMVGCLPFIHPHDVFPSATEVGTTTDERTGRFRQWMHLTMRRLIADMRAGHAAWRLLLLHPHIFDAHLGGSEMGAFYAIHSEDIPPGAHYVACGHIHRQQRIAGALSPTFYSGSPMSFDFGESDPKSVTIVDFIKGEELRTQQLPLTTGRRCVRHTGTPSEVLPALVAHANEWAEVVLQGHDPQMEQAIRAHPRVLAVRYDTVTNAAPSVKDARTSMRERAPRDQFIDYLLQKGRVPEPALIDKFELLYHEALTEKE